MQWPADFGTNCPHQEMFVYSVEDIVKLLLHTDLWSSRYITTKVPTSISESASFLIDLDKQDDVLLFW